MNCQSMSAWTCQSCHFHEARVQLNLIPGFDAITTHYICQFCQVKSKPGSAAVMTFCKRSTCGSQCNVVLQSTAIDQELHGACSHCLQLEGRAAIHSDLDCQTRLLIPFSSSILFLQGRNGSCGPRSRQILGMLSGSPSPSAPPVMTRSAIWPP